MARQLEHGVLPAARNARGEGGPARREQNLRVHLQFGSTLGDNLVHHCVSWNATVASVFVGHKVCERVRAVKPIRTTHAQATEKVAAELDPRNSADKCLSERRSVFGCRTRRIVAQHTFQ